SGQLEARNVMIEIKPYTTTKGEVTIKVYSGAGSTISTPTTTTTTTTSKPAAIPTVAAVVGPALTLPPVLGAAGAVHDPTPSSAKQIELSENMTDADIDAFLGSLTVGEKQALLAEIIRRQDLVAKIQLLCLLWGPDMSAGSSSIPSFVAN